MGGTQVGAGGTIKSKRTEGGEGASGRTSMDSIAGTPMPFKGGCGGHGVPTASPPMVNVDTNNDGELKVLIIGTSRSIEDGHFAFPIDGIVRELQSILNDDLEIEGAVTVIAEDIYRTRQVLTGLGSRGDSYDWMYSCHSLMQYLMWPEGRDERLAQLSGNGVHDWDHVIIAGDPYIVRQMPGYHALGANQVAQHVVDGGAQAHLLMVWGQENEGSMSGIIRRIGASQG